VISFDFLFILGFDNVRCFNSRKVTWWAYSALFVYNDFFPSENRGKEIGSRPNHISVPEREIARTSADIFSLFSWRELPPISRAISLSLIYQKLYTPLLPSPALPAAPPCLRRSYLHRTKRGVHLNLVPGKHKAFVSCFFFPKNWFCLRLDPNNFFSHFDWALPQSSPSSTNTSFCLALADLDLRMGREDETVDAMEIDGQRQLVGGPTAVPEGFNADYLRVYYGKVVRSLKRVRLEILRNGFMGSVVVEAIC
jgi:hypothetical protein